MGSITIPTTELIGCISDVLPVIADPRGSSLAGFALEWDGEALRFTAYDILAGATVEWVPGEGAEGDDPDDEIEWGGNADPFRIFVRHDHAKEILKLFKLPAKLWRFPVTLKVNLSLSKLIIEREDGPRGERLLTVPTANEELPHIPRVQDLASGYPEQDAETGLLYANIRLGAFGTVRPHGAMRFIPRGQHEPTGVRIGSRFEGFLYREGARVQRHNLLRDGAGVHNADIAA